jgi:hypothetical protein
MQENKSKSMKFDRITLLRIVLGIILFLVAIALIQVFSLAADLRILSRSQNLIFLFGIGVLAMCLMIIIIAALLVATWTGLRTSVTNLFDMSFNLLEKLGFLNLFLFSLVIVVFSYLMIGPFNSYLGVPGLRWTSYILLVLAGTMLIKASGVNLKWHESLLAALLISAVGYKLATFMPEITIYPFSLGWSETSRYYYASLYLSDQLYGFNIPPSVLHPSRYLMQAAPFLIPDSPLWLHRLWQVLLWITTTLTSAILLARRLTIEDRFKRGMFILWVSLFLLLAPVYYHLQISVILILWGFDKRKPWRTLFIVVLASIWAGISRINWYPVPGMLAAVLYFLEQPVHPDNRQSRSPLIYLSYPVIWVTLGAATAFISQMLYVIWSGNPVELFSSSFTSDLLWYRLFPNATFPLGILTGALLVFTPMFLLMLYELRAKWRLIHPLRILGTVSILLVLFGGGLVVSVKIGGGSNLHNIDAFLVLFLIVFSYVFFDRVAEETNQSDRETTQPKNSIAYWILLSITILTPAVLIISQRAGYRLPNNSLIRESITQIQEAINNAANDGNPVLFISERQLLLFNTVKGVPLIPDYEKVFLMEMAMANNRGYLNKLYEDLSNHRFALIVSDPLKLVYQDRTHNFSEENNAWVERVVEPILCYYEPLTTMKRVRTELLIPKLNNEDCQYSQD